MFSCRKGGAIVSAGKTEILNSIQKGIEGAMRLHGSKGNIAIFQAPKGSVEGIELLIQEHYGQLVICTSEVTFENKLFAAGYTKDGVNCSAYATLASKAMDGGKSVSQHQFVYLQYYSVCFIIFKCCLCACVSRARSSRQSHSLGKKDVEILSTIPSL